jgi:hypothetical protein
MQPTADRMGASRSSGLGSSNAARENKSPARGLPWAGLLPPVPGRSPREAPGEVTLPPRGDLLPHPRPERLQQAEIVHPIALVQ